MKFKSYIKDKTLLILVFVITVLLEYCLFTAFKALYSLEIMIITLEVIDIAVFIGIDYIKRNTFYNQLKSKLEVLEKKYLVLETISCPDFEEGKFVYDCMYDINSSMLENIVKYKRDIDNFKEYLEMWIHEIKLPIANLMLICHNNETEITTQVLLKLQQLDLLSEQLLYYVRSEYSNQDYLIRTTKLSSVIKPVAMRYKENLLASNIAFEVNVGDTTVRTDAKWLEFILNQIVNNSIKYKNDVDPKISIWAKETKKNTTLFIRDNGIGIPKEDLQRVFKKTFTGTNGRKYAQATGMGLYIVKNLCKKLGHEVSIKSEVGEYTQLEIIFDRNDFYDVV